MAVTAKDGTPFTNPAHARMHDRKMDARKPAAAPAKPEADMDDESQSPDEVVAEHGPAKQVLIKHDGMKHTVRSKHDDGHTHESTHESAEEAHDTAKTLSGVDGQEPEADSEGGSAGVLGSLMGQ